MNIITYTKIRLQNLLKKQITNKDCNFYLNDKSYAVMDSSWLKGDCYQAYRRWLNLAGISKWKTNWDCDNFAQSFKTYVNILHARENPETFTTKHAGAKNTTDAHAAAVGVMFFKNSDRSAHAVNMVIAENDEILFFEPDGGAFLNLNNKHKESIWYVNF